MLRTSYAKCADWLSGFAIPPKVWVGFWFWSLPLQLLLGGFGWPISCWGGAGCLPLFWHLVLLKVQQKPKDKEDARWYAYCVMLPYLSAISPWCTTRCIATCMTQSLKITSSTPWAMAVYSYRYHNFTASHRAIRTTYLSHVSAPFFQTLFTFALPLQVV